MQPWMMRTQVCSNERPHFFSRGHNNEIAKIHSQNYKNLLLQNHCANFKQTWHNASLGDEDSSLFKWRTHLFSRGDNNENGKIHWQDLKIFQIWHNASWVKGFQVCWNEWPNPFPRGRWYEIAKIHWQNFKIFFSRTAWLISTKLGKMHPWLKGFQVCSNEEPFKNFIK